MNVLFIVPGFPAPSDTGRKVRHLGQLRALARRYRVTLVAFVDEGWEAGEVR